MKAAIIGTGFLGEQIYQEIKDSYDEIILTHNKNKRHPDSRQFDFFTDNITEVFGGKKIDVIFLPTRIEFAEDSESLKEAMMRFLEATLGSRIIYVSSDSVFDGMKGMYKESDAINPANLYGRNLKICEDLVKEKSQDFCIVRPSLLYGFVAGQLDKRFQKTKEEFEEGKMISRFMDMYKSPLSYQQAAQAIAKVASLEYQGILHISGKRMSYFDFTKEGMEALGMSTENLVGEKMPKDKWAEFLPDTSLDASLMEKLTGVHPLSIKESFERHGI